MKFVIVILCLSCIVELGVSSTTDRKDGSIASVLESGVEKDNADDLEGAETAAKLFNLGSLFPTYGPSTGYRPGGYPTGGGYYPSSTGGSYYPSSTGGSYYPTYNPTQSYYPNSGYYPTGTNIIGNGYGGYPTQSYYPPSYSIGTGGYRSSSGYGGSAGYGGYSGSSGYGGYGGNGGLRSYYGYNSPQYSGKRNLGFGYFPETDRYGFYRSPSQQLSVSQGYN